VLCLGSVSAVFTSHALDLKQSKVTQVVNDVQIISAADQTKKDAAINDLLSLPDILRTAGVAGRTGGGGRDGHARGREHDFHL